MPEGHPMYHDLFSTLDKLGVTYDKAELQEKIDKLERETVAKTLVQQAKGLNLSLETNQAKTVIAALSRNYSTDPIQAAEALTHYHHMDEDKQRRYRDELYSQFLRQTPEFDTIMQLNGDYAKRWF
ncbi:MULTISPECIES: hypothetical protein [Vibrio]|jgi:hypothetical protein|nr:MULTISPECIES: hypothetical protein [Vibrio]